jgi:hypothetical protein
MEEIMGELIARIKHVLKILHRRPHFRNVSTKCHKLLTFKPHSNISCQACNT